jgi:hypothetical protein
MYSSLGLGIKISSSQGPTALGKYLMRSPTGEIIFGGESFMGSSFAYIIWVGHF